MTKSSPARHAFLYLVSFLALAFVAYGVGTLCFQIINYFFPEEFETWNNTLSQGQLKFAIASLIITSPVYFYSTRIINQDLLNKGLDYNSGVRKWLTYIALFIASGFVIGDLIATIFSYLDGELSIRFFLKALTILIISGSIILYYFSDIRSEKPTGKNKLWAIIFWFMVTLPFIGSLCLIENPKITRLKKIDTQVVEQLSMIQNQINTYSWEKEKLPQSYDELKDFDGKPMSTGYQQKMIEKYQIIYMTRGKDKYQLCATFQRDNREDTENQSRYANYSEWLHGEGNHCFDLTVDLERRKPEEEGRVPMIR